MLEKSALETLYGGQFINLVDKSKVSLKVGLTFKA